MHVNPSKPLPAIGFLTAIENPTHGFFGGYLVVSTLGRPLEFHCTTPVQPTSAQKILYGQAIRPYLLGELIGQTLLQKAQLPVQAVLTDQLEMLSVRLWRDEPVAWLPAASQADREELASTLPVRLELADHLLLGEQICGWSPDTLQSAVQPLTEHIDLAEPFERIAAAIAEAQRMTDPREGNDHESSAAA